MSTENADAKQAKPACGCPNPEPRTWPPLSQPPTEVKTTTTVSFEENDLHSFGTTKYGPNGNTSFVMSGNNVYFEAMMLRKNYPRSRLQGSVRGGLLLGGFRCMRLGSH
jgi:hypothetical protein